MAQTLKLTSVPVGRMAVCRSGPLALVPHERSVVGAGSSSSAGARAASAAPSHCEVASAASGTSHDGAPGIAGPPTVIALTGPPPLKLTAAVTQEGAWYVAQCLELDVASQGESVEEALVNLREALELRLEGEPAPVSQPSAPIIAPVEVSVDSGSSGG